MFLAFFSWILLLPTFAAPTNDSTPKTTTYSLDPAMSTIEWAGGKTYIEDYAHTGTIEFESGELTVNSGKLTDARLLVDMSTIKATNIEKQTGEQLKGHLMSMDFFDVENHPNASIASDNIKYSDNENAVIRASMTIKGKTNVIEFPARIYLDGDNLKVEAQLSFDRTKWGIAYGSEKLIEGLAEDYVISDMIDLKINLVAHPS